jgi:DNA-binding MarR family transcriptional regulator
MVRNAQSPSTDRSAQIDYVADNLLSRAALLVRLLVKQVPTGDVSRTEVEVLAVLREGPRRITELAELEGLAQPTMTVLVKRLETRGWVSRSGLRGDGRVVLVAITAHGRKAVEAFRAEFLAALRSDLEELSARELAALSRATRALGSFVDSLQREA